MSRSRRPSEVATDSLATLLKMSKSVFDNVPIASGVVGGLVWITDTAQQFRTNKDAWKDFSEYTAALRDDIQSFIDKASTSASADLSADILNLQEPLMRIVQEMQQMKKRSLVSKFLQTQEDPKKIVVFRQMLVDASMKFNTKQLVAINLKLESMTLERECHSTEVLKPRILIPKWKLCPSPSHLFTGRQNILDHLMKFFAVNSEGRKQRVFVLCGLGGSGKSQLAFRFVELSQAEPKVFSEVFMIDATTTESIESDFKSLSQAKGLGDSFKIALHWLVAEKSNWLIIFDNADHVSLNLREYFPKCSHGNILITTRNQAVRLHGSGRGSHFNIAEMNATDAECLLVRILETSIEIDDKMRALVTILAAELGWFALALVQVGSYIVTSECGINRYLETFRARKGALLEEGSIDAQKLDDYQHSAYTTWRLSFEKLPREAPKFLQLCSFLHHDGITERIFRTAYTNATSSNWVSKDICHIISTIFGVDLIAWDALKFLNIMSDIRSFSLMNFDPTNETYSIHPLVQTWIRVEVEPAAVTRQAAMSILALCVDLPGDDWEHSECYDRVFQDSLAVHADAALQREQAGSAAIAERLSWMYYEGRIHSKAISLCNEASVLQNNQLGPEHPKTLAVQCMLAFLYGVTGNLRKAELLSHSTFLAAKRVMRTNHRFIFKCGIVLTYAYRILGMLEKAEELLHTNLEECHDTHGPSDWNTLACMAELGAVLRARGRLSEAEVVLKKAIDIRKRLKGLEDEDTLVLMLRLSQTYVKQGRSCEAERILLELMETWTPIHGPYHAVVLDVKGVLATVYMDQRRLDEAASLNIEVLDCYKQIYDPSHPQTFVVMGNLAQVYLRQHRLDEAEELLIEVLSYEAWGKDHFTRLRYSSLLARVYHLQKRTEHATHLMEEILQRLTVQLGLEHRSTQEAKDDLARWKDETESCNCSYYY